ncbi:MAG: hypothetical protein CMC55_05210 [Flavobacteriaceae bacterium]|uniref:hypothetical protein n=1 Tax=Bizionia echini TaxID=649333 RepID=UPI000C913F9B|nr:hypothetical protein [Flavobacteriaceae bacterium]|tara:strand:+ start:391 stop:933 length:543 start_codon:yes stop_codon:yes gene_type:complete
MTIGKKFNQLDKSEYLLIIENYKQYKDFNTLGLYRSICENENLDLETRMEVRDFAHTIFKKTFNFYQLKDPITYFELTTLGMNLTVADERQAWKEIRENQEKILSDKKIKHRNFGDYSKHNCGYDNCPYNGIMIKQGTGLSENHMWFETDKKKENAKNKSKNRKKQRREKHKIIRDDLDK